MDLCAVSLFYFISFFQFFFCFCFSSTILIRFWCLLSTIGRISHSRLFYTWFLMCCVLQYFFCCCYLFRFFFRLFIEFVSQEYTLARSSAPELAATLTAPNEQQEKYVYIKFDVWKKWPKDSSSYSFCFGCFFSWFIHSLCHSLLLWLSCAAWVWWGR